MRTLMGSDAAAALAGDRAIKSQQRTRARLNSTRETASTTHGQRASLHTWPRRMHTQELQCARV